MAFLQLGFEAQFSSAKTQVYDVLEARSKELRKVEILGRGGAVLINSIKTRGFVWKLSER